MRPLAATLALLFPVAALADLSNTVTLSVNQALSLDTGVIGTSGDIQFTGTRITPQGQAGVFYFDSLGVWYYGDYLTQSSMPRAGVYLPLSITGALLVVNRVFAVQTNGGNFAKVWITALSPSSVTIEFYTYGASGGGISGPTITAVQNNYSNLFPSQPNYGIAPGTIFIIQGTNLASAATVSSLQSSAAPGLPLSLNGASVSVTVGSVTTHPAFYYATATQLALVLPSSTPVGTGTVSASYNGGTASVPILVVPAALGLDTVSGIGKGLGVATIGATVLNYNNSAAPGQTIVLWGSGLGADAADSDTTFTSTPHAIGAPLQVYVGGLPAVVAYQGASGCPGLNQINVTIPAGVQPGCGVSVVALSGTIASNTVTIPVNPGGACSDPLQGISGSQLVTLGSKASYGGGVVGIFQATTPTGVRAQANFDNNPGVVIGSVGQLSIGNCAVSALTPSTAPSPFPASTPLDAGTLNVTGPYGTQSLPEEQDSASPGQPTGMYLEFLKVAFPDQAGSFTFTGSGGTFPGASVGAFTATLNLSASPVWSNMSSIATVNRAQDLTVTWTVGASNTYAVIGITGSSTDLSTGVGVSFICNAPAAAGQFTVPSYVLNALPAGPGALNLTAQTTPQAFSAAGLDIASVVGSSVVSLDNVPFN